MNSRPSIKRLEGSKNYSTILYFLPSKGFACRGAAFGASFNGAMCSRGTTMFWATMFSNTVTSACYSNVKAVKTIAAAANVAIITNNLKNYFI